MSVTFMPSGRGKAQCSPDPDYPNGKSLDIAAGGPSCMFDLPYPAPECGAFVVQCDTCEMRIAVTAAGRPDDPVSIKVPCQRKTLSN